MATKKKKQNKLFWDLKSNTGPLKAKSVASLIADPGVMGLIPPQSHTFVKIDHEIISTVILLPLIQERLVSVNTRES